MIDSVMLVDRDRSIPPKQALRLTGHPAHNGFPEGLTLEACENSETTDSHHLDVIASYGVDVEVLVDAINLVLGYEAVTFIAEADL